MAAKKTVKSAPKAASKKTLKGSTKLAGTKLMFKY